MTTLTFQTDTGPLQVEVTRLVIAGWTGRDPTAVALHIEELAAIGVPRPSTVPLYYRVARALLTQAAAVEMLGPASSGEAEPVLVRAQDRWWLTVGSDHTDRALEAHSVAQSKQLCAKPIATVAWLWDDVAGRADTLRFGAEIVENDRWVRYQEGSFASVRPLMSLADGYRATHPIENGCVMFCGTLAAIPNAGGATVRPASRMRLSLRDPRRDRSIVHEYGVTALPVVA